MNLATLRVDGEDQALQDVCKLLGLEPDQTFKKGDPKRNGGFFSKSCFSATIANTKNPGEMVFVVREFVARCKARNFVFGSDFSAVISIGVTVGDPEQFVAFIDFSASDLLALGALGCELSIAAYPTSDEANEINQDA